MDRGYINYNISDFISSMHHNMPLLQFTHVDSFNWRKGGGGNVSSFHTDLRLVSVEMCDLETFRPTSIDLISAITPSGKQQQMSPNRASPRKSLGGGGLSPPSPVARPLSQMYTMCFPEGWREGMRILPTIP